MPAMTIKRTTKETDHKAEFVSHSLDGSERNRSASEVASVEGAQFSARRHMACNHIKACVRVVRPCIAFSNLQAEPAYGPSRTSILYRGLCSLCPGMRALCKCLFERARREKNGRVHWVGQGLRRNLLVRRGLYEPGLTVHARHLPGLRRDL